MSTAQTHHVSVYSSKDFSTTATGKMPTVGAHGSTKRPPRFNITASSVNNYPANTANYSSDDDDESPAVRKARISDRRRNIMEAEEAVRSKALFQKMGIFNANTDDDDDDDEEEESDMSFHTEMPVVVVPQLELEIEAAAKKISTLEGELMAVKKQLTASGTRAETEKATLAAQLQQSAAECFRLHQALEETTSSQQSGLQIKSELLERQVASLQASGERVEAERSALAARNEQLMMQQRDMQSQLTKYSSAAAAIATSAQCEQGLQSEIYRLEEELEIMQSSLQAADAAAKEASQREQQVLQREANLVADKIAAQKVNEALKLELKAQRERNAATVTELNEMALKAHAAETEVQRMQNHYVQQAHQAEEQHRVETGALKIEITALTAAATAAASQCAALQHRVDASHIEIENAKLQGVKNNTVRQHQAELEALMESAKESFVREKQELESALAVAHEERASLHALSSQLQNELQRSQQECATRTTEHQSLQQQLAAAEFSATEAASAHTIALLAAQKRVGNAEIRHAAAQKQIAALVAANKAKLLSPVPENDTLLLEDGRAGKRCLVGRKRSTSAAAAAGDVVDLEGGGVSNLIVKASDEVASLSTRVGRSSVFQRYPRGMIVLATLYSLLLHCLLLSGTLCRL